jgi:hypothetical protein
MVVIIHRDQIEISDLPLELRPPECQFGPEGIPSTDTKKIRIAKNLSKEELTKPLGTGGINTAIKRGQEKNHHAQFWTMFLMCSYTSVGLVLF